MMTLSTSETSDSLPTRTSSVPRRARRPHQITTDTGVHVLLAHYSRTKDVRARDAVIAYYAKFVRSLAARFLSGSEPLDDLVQVGTIGLIRAVDRYDPDRALPFPAYAAPSILGEIKHHFRDRTWQVKVPRWLQERLLRARRVEQALQMSLGASPTPAEIACELGVTEEEVLEAMEVGRGTRALSLDGTQEGPAGDDGFTLAERVGARDAALLDLEAYADLRRALACLNPRECEILRLRFFEDLSQSAVAERLGLSQMHVSRLQQRALDRLRGILAD